MAFLMRSTKHFRKSVPMPVMPILYKLLHKIEKEEVLLSLLDDTGITGLSKTDQHVVRRKENYRSISLINIAAKLF